MLRLEGNPRRIGCGVDNKLRGLAALPKNYHYKALCSLSAPTHAGSTIVVQLGLTYTRHCPLLILCLPTVFSDASHAWLPSASDAVFCNFGDKRGVWQKGFSPVPNRCSCRWRVRQSEPAAQLRRTSTMKTHGPLVNPTWNVWQASISSLTEMNFCTPHGSVHIRPFL
eukprot:3751275-Amphidinium_carterae.1